MAPGSPDWSLVMKNRSADSVRSSAASRVIHPRSTPIGYADNAKPTTAMLDGAPARVVSAISPFEALPFARKYSKASRCS